MLFYSTRDGKLHYCAVPDDPDRSVSQSVSQSVGGVRGVLEGGERKKRSQVRCFFLIRLS